MEKPRGDITTVLDRVDRDSQDQFFFPIQADDSWFTRDQSRRIHSSVPIVQEHAPRGPVAFGQTFSFEIGSLAAGDLLQGVMLQLRLTSWLDPNTVTGLQSQNVAYQDPATAWYYANSLGTAIIDWAELQVDGVTIERITGDFSYVFSVLFPDINTQSSFNYDAVYKYSNAQIASWPQRRPYPTESGTVNIFLPFFFSRTRMRQTFPLISCKEGSVRIMIRLRPFQDLIRTSTPRTSCDETPLGKTFKFYNPPSAFDSKFSIVASNTIPELADIRLVTYSVILDGQVRQSLLRKPFELLYREVQHFAFSEPSTYKAVQVSDTTIQVQIDLEARGPLEEIVWFIRRKDVALENDWTNYSTVLASQLDETYNPQRSFLTAAKIYVNGIELISADGDYFRQEIAKKHRGGITAYNSFVYGYSMSQTPGQHQPAGTLNASRMNSLRLTCDIAASNTEFEVVVFCIGLNWIRFQNGIANRLFQD